MKLLVFLFGCLLAVSVAFLALGNWPLGHAPQLTFPVASAADMGQPQPGAAAPAVKVGVYYFPGWRDRTPHAPSDFPWEPIKRFAEREPALGWYDEGSMDVMQSHVNTMAANGLSFVMFDWYWGTDDEVYLDHALRAFRQVADRKGLQFALLWANHDGAPASLENFDHMVAYWIVNYFTAPEYLRVDGKPMVTVFSAEQFDKDARRLNTDPATLMARANAAAQSAGLPGIYFVAGAQSDEPNFHRFAQPSSGYSAVSAYNLHWLPGAPHSSHSYKELDAAYRSHWQRYETLGGLPVIYPMSSGWDKRAWGGSDDPKHDDSVATPDEFEAHVRAGVAAMLKTPAPRMGVICCWNEFGEGSYIEPTKQLGSAVVDRVGRVLNAGRAP